MEWPGGPKNSKTSKTTKITKKLKNPNLNFWYVKMDLEKPLDTFNSPDNFKLDNWCDNLCQTVKIEIFRILGRFLTQNSKIISRLQNNHFKPRHRDMGIFCFKAYKITKMPDFGVFRRLSAEVYTIFFGLISL